MRFPVSFGSCPSGPSGDLFLRSEHVCASYDRLTDLISGRPARCLQNRFTSLSDSVGIPPLPDCPIAYDAGKALNKAARNCGESGFGAYWAGQGAPLARAMPVGQLMDKLKEELHRAHYSKT
ncbi:nitronate monooxygenase (plasmid) [Komagataeibacter sucrofermentans]